MNDDMIVVNGVWYEAISYEKVRARQRERAQVTYERRKKMKRRAIEYLGGQCADCKQRYPLAVYDFHHLDPSQKDEKYSSLFLKANWEAIKIEMDKCVVLCANCHRVRHHGNET